MNDLDFWLSNKDADKPAEEDGKEEVKVKVTPVPDLSSEEETKSEQTLVCYSVLTTTFV